MQIQRENRDKKEKKKNFHTSFNHWITPKKYFQKNSKRS